MELSEIDTHQPLPPFVFAPPPPIEGPHTLEDGGQNGAQEVREIDDGAKEEGQVSEND